MKLLTSICTRSITLFIAVLLSLNGFIPCQARSEAQQSSLQPEGTLIRVNANLITVPVSVTDSAGLPVRDLQIGDFSLEENGSPEPLERFAEPGQTPVELAMLLDISGSLRARFEFEQRAAARFLRRVLRPEDSFAIFSIGPQPGVIQPRTANIEEGLRSLGAVAPSSGSTAFYDAVVLAARSLSQSRTPGRRRVQVVLSDGEDNNSESARLAEALEEVQRADCMFYSINPAGPSIRLNRVSIEGQASMSRLAGHTGGMAFVLEQGEDLNPIFDRIAAELRAQYLLEYYSSDQRRDGAYRRIIVRVPNRPNLRIHARQGYYASQG